MGYHIPGAKGVVGVVNAADTSSKMRPQRMCSGFSPGKLLVVFAEQFHGVMICRGQKPHCSEWREQ